MSKCRIVARQPLVSERGLRKSLLLTLTVGVHVFIFAPIITSAMDPVQATLGKETAWTGEAVPLVVTLYSPGPFSGTASFQLPELPRTALVKVGNPVVGSEDVDGESYLTQRYEFKLFTQQSGEIVIPEFRVRFSGKKTFTSEAEPVEGQTSKLRFMSKRPPGTEGMGFVVSATKMEFRQSWNPEQIQELQAGDIVHRTLQRTAEGTTAMMLPPAETNAPEGVSVHTASPEVYDNIDRGEATAHRKDIIKYQFQQTGLFATPDLIFVWWDPQEEVLKRETLSGTTFQVTTAHQQSLTDHGEVNEKSSATVWIVATGALLLGFAMLITRMRHVWRQPHHAADVRAARDLRAACRSNNASGAYSALMAWLAVRRAIDGLDSTDANHEEWRGLRDQSDVLSRHLFARAAPDDSWHGRPLWEAFCKLQTALRRQSSRPHRTSLPTLNPNLPSASAEHLPE